MESLAIVASSQEFSLYAGLVAYRRGGAMLIACGHALDVVRWYLGEVAEVNGQVQTLVQETRFSDTGEVVPVDAIDTVACMARLASGVTGTVHVSNVCKRGSGFHLD